MTVYNWKGLGFLKNNINYKYQRGYIKKSLVADPKY